MRVDTSYVMAYTSVLVSTRAFEWYTWLSIQVDYRGKKAEKQVKKVKNRENGDF